MTEETKTTFENEQTATTEDIADVLHFDPFKKGDEIPSGNDNLEGKPADKATTEEGNEKDTPAPAPAPEPAPSTKAAEPAKSSEDQAAHWRAIAEARQADLDRVTKKPEEKVKDEDAIPNYDFQIADEHIDALTSEDKTVFKKAVEALAKGIAVAVHTQMVPAIAQKYNPKLEAIPAMITQAIVGMQKAEEIRKDFYGTYPELDHPQFKQLVQKTAERKAKELGITSWNKQLRDETAKEVKTLLAVASGAAANGAGPNPPARMLPQGGTRPAPTNQDSLARDIADTLGF